MKAYSYINEMAASGEFYFTTQDLVKKLHLSASSASAMINRLRAKKEVATPYKGFHLIIPPEYRALGCLPPEQFIHDLMDYLKTPYYVTLLSAAQFYGAAHQKPQVFQVMLPKARARIHCGKIAIDFSARKNMQDLPVRQFKTPKGYVNVSTPELTALDVANYPLRSGGLNNVVTVLEELAESIEQKALLELVKMIDITPQLQRLGFFLEAIQQEDLASIVEEELAQRRMNQALLVPKIESHDESKIHPRWKIIINETWESDL